MVSEGHMRELVERRLAGTGHFLVDVEVRPGGKVVVEVDDPRAITLEQLVALNRALRADLDAQGLDLELQVGSPGVGRPFKVPAQFTKHIGRPVTVKLADGRALEGRLESADAASLGLRQLLPAKVKGRPDKLADDVLRIPRADILSTQASLKLK